MLLDRASREGVRQAIFHVELMDYTEDDRGLRWRVALHHPVGMASGLGVSGHAALENALTELARKQG